MNKERTSRGSIVFAGAFDDELISGIEQPIHCVHTVFDAIGELATCVASDLVEAVVIDENLITTNPIAAIDAVRRVDPSAVVVVMGEMETDHADANVPKDTTASRLTAAILNAKSTPSKQDVIGDVDLDAVLGISDETMIVRD